MCNLPGKQAVSIKGLLQFINIAFNTSANQHGILCPYERLFHVDSILCWGLTDCLEGKKIDGWKSARYFYDATEECLR